MASNSPFSSNSAVSSLLKSAQSTAAKAKSLQDAQIAFEWAQSPKTAEDFAAYSKYLNDRITGADASETLSLQKTLSSAQSGYISNEIQRQSQSVMEGSQDNTTKFNNIANLYHQAINSGNYDSALSIRGTLDSLSVTIQNEEKARRSAGQALSGQLAAANARSIDDFQNKADNIVNTINDVVRNSNARDVQAFLSDTKKLKSLGLDVQPGSSYVDVLASVAGAKISNIDSALAVATDPDNIAKFQKLYNELAQKGVVSIPTKDGSKSLTMQDLQDWQDAARVGQQLYQEVSSGKGTFFEPTKVSGYVFGRQADGSYRLITNRSGAPKYTSAVPNLDKNGNPTDTKQSYKDLVKRAKFTVVSGDNSETLEVLNDKGQFDKFGIARGEAVQLFVDPDGNLQFANGDKAYNFSFDNAGKFTGLYETRPNPVTFLNDQFNNDFLSTLDPNTLNAGTFAVIDNNPLSPAFHPNQPGTILGNALSAQVQLQKSAAVAKLAANTGVSQAPATNLQPTVNPSALPANASLSIAKPVALPPIKVVASPPPPNLKVNTAPNTQQIKINNKPNTQTIRI